MLGMMDCAGLFYVPFWISAAATYIGESRPAFGLLFSSAATDRALANAVYVDHINLFLL
jgi:hypothetical protein